MPEMPGLLWTSGGPLAVLALVAWLVIIGRLRPDRQFRELRQDRDTRLEEAQQQISEWRAAWNQSEAARQAQQELLRDNLEVARTIEHLVRAFREAAGSQGATHD